MTIQVLTFWGTRFGKEEAEIGKGKSLWVLLQRSARKLGKP
jgi:hypothetical protein